MIALISQREEENNFGNSIDVLESAYSSYFGKKDVILVAIPNSMKNVGKYFELNPDFLILSGGADSKNRNYVETQLLQTAIDKNIPVLGICKGMQFINLFFGGKLERIEGHVAKNHYVEINGAKENVNSYHDLGFHKSGLGKGLKVFALGEDGSIEGIYHSDKKVIGIMWHPERDEKIYDKVVDKFLENGGSKEWLKL
ncbi:gamma-glutamyl-gamma-aminobutyrate hydrolase family protein [Candidatus Pacearchaeota archaeon]|nr:gamma-glutamyl-gamma-aminobutyrate hydrolase family protein [Candidatus Pacearchaeota archaeon]